MACGAEWNTLAQFNEEALYVLPVLEVGNGIGFIGGDDVVGL